MNPTVIKRLVKLAMETKNPSEASAAWNGVLRILRRDRTEAESVWKRLRWMQTERRVDTVARRKWKINPSV